VGKQWGKRMRNLIQNLNFLKEFLWFWEIWLSEMPGLPHLPTTLLVNRCMVTPWISIKFFVIFWIINGFTVIVCTLYATEVVLGDFNAVLGKEIIV
jgi:hypothetical protein